MPERSISCPHCGHTADVDVPEGSPFATCPACSGVCELATQADLPRSRLKLKNRPDSPPAGIPERPPTVPEPGQDAGAPPPVPALAPPPLPPPSPVVLPLPDDEAPSVTEREPGPLARALKFTAWLLLIAAVLTGIHVLGRLDNGSAYYFAIVSGWVVPILLNIGLLALTYRRSLVHFLLIFFLPMMLMFSLLGSAPTDDVYATRSTLESAAIVVTVFAYPIYLFFVVIRVIESTRFKIWFFAFVLSSIFGSAYDFTVSDADQEVRLPPLLEKVLDYNRGAPRPDVPTL